MTLELAFSPRRATLRFPNVQVADEKAREWGEAVWTHPLEFSLATLAVTPTDARWSAAMLGLGREA